MRSDPSWLVGLNGTLFFIADDGTNGEELWKSDGTMAGTALVKDVNPGPDGSTIGSLTVAGQELFFVADDGINGEELWKSDGTTAGTVLVKEITLGPSGTTIDALAALGQNLFFVADNGTNGSELWTSDGTEAGTVLLKDINPGPADSSDRRSGGAGPEPVLWRRRRHQRLRAVEERRHRRRHRAGQGYWPQPGPISKTLHRCQWYGVFRRQR